MTRPRLTALLFFLVAGGCADEGRGKTAAPTPTPGTPTSPGPTVQERPALVYGHSATMLYTVDAETLVVKPVGAFVWPNGGDQMTDIALDRDGNMIGISYDTIYAVDKNDAKCTFLSHFNGDQFNGLSFIYAAAADGVEETLVGAASDGRLYKIDPMSGAQTFFGQYGGGWGSSGDLVSVQGATYATVTSGFDASDTLVKVDPATGQATKIGSTGYNNIFGLGYWKQKLFGFTESSGLVTIDVNTGQATPIASGGTQWWGAGVTTAAPITVQ